MKDKLLMGLVLAMFVWSAWSIADFQNDTNEYQQIINAKQRVGVITC